MTDWLNASKHECAKLHRQVRRFVDERNLRPDRLLNQIYAGTITVGKDDFNNLRKGSLSKKKVSLIARWFEKHHPEVLVASEPPTQSRPPSAPGEITASYPTPIKRWKSFIQQHGMFGKVDVQLIEPRPPISIPEEPEKLLNPTRDAQASSIAPPDTNPLSDIAVRLNEAFHFRFTPEISGSLLALQQAGYPWWEPLPLHGDEAFLILDQPTLVLPQDQSGTPLPLLETERAGRHRFVFLLAPSSLIAPTFQEIGGNWQASTFSLDALAQRLAANEGQWQIMRLDVMIIA